MNQGLYFVTDNQEFNHESSCGRCEKQYHTKIEDFRKGSVNLQLEDRQIMTRISKLATLFIVDGLRLVKFSFIDLKILFLIFMFLQPVQK